ncbi:MAG: hypothetical protein ACTSSE_01155 [Candidatus Thorarchaeota archaeon]
MSTAWGLIPLGMEESDLVMLLVSLFILAVLVIIVFIVLGWFLGLLGTLVIIFGIYYGVMELRKENQSE